MGVGNLRQNLSRYLQAVRAGEEVVVTTRGRAVARLVPVAQVSARNNRRRELVRLGALRPRERRLTRSFWTQPKPADPKGAVLRALLEERAKGR